MEDILKLFWRFKGLTLLSVAFAVVYIVQALTSVPSHQILHKYHTTVGQVHLLTLSVIIPYIVIWMIGLVGYLRLKSYVDVLGDSKDGQAFRTIALGILLLVLWLPTSVILADVAVSYYTNHPEAIATQTRIVNYYNVIVLIPAFYFLYVGSKQLGNVARIKTHGLSQRQSFAFMIFGVLYTFVVLQDSLRHVSHDPTVAATYYEPDWLIVFTIIIPRLASWFMGLAGAANILLYRKRVKGAIYKLALRQLAIGISVVLVSVILLRVLQSLTSVISGISLGILFLLVYLLLALIATGYIYIAKGATKLLKIEQL